MIFNWFYCLYYCFYDLCVGVCYFLVFCCWCVLDFSCCHVVFNNVVDVICSYDLCVICCCVLIVVIDFYYFLLFVALIFNDFC